RTESVSPAWTVEPSGVDPKIITDVQSAIDRVRMAGGVCRRLRREATSETDPSADGHDRSLGRHWSNWTSALVNPHRSDPTSHLALVQFYHPFPRPSRFHPVDSSGTVVEESCDVRADRRLRVGPAHRSRWDGRSVSGQQGRLRG